MSHVPEIDVHAARELHQSGEALFVDIRDPASRADSHIAGSKHLTPDVLETFVQETDKATPLVVYCYHGNSSKGATAYLMEQGFADVRSLAGGFEAWRTAFGSAAGGPG